MEYNYKKLSDLQTRINRLNHLKEVAFWDQATNMSEKGLNARSEAIAELSQIVHELECDPNNKKIIFDAENEDLSETERANLVEIKRKFERTEVIPKELLKEKHLAASLCEHGWRKQRFNNDWKSFLENFKKVVTHSREEAKILAEKFEVSPYEALMDKYEPHLTEMFVDDLFGEIKSWLPNLLAKVLAKQANEPVIVTEGSFQIEKQKQLGLEIMEVLGFDFKAGRLDESIHPFCGGTPEDVRITTRYKNTEFLPALMGTIHETGHARYEQNLPSSLLDQPVGQARSMSIHESQSLFFEKHIGGHPRFIERIHPKILSNFGEQPSTHLENLKRLILKVKPSFIRVDADEITYPAHIILRYEIEKGLINGDVEAEDIPQLWDEKMEELLGISTKGEFCDGPMQDVHWPEGLFGYFPCYTLGALYAAQWKDMIQLEHSNFDDIVGKENLNLIFHWLDENIWKNASIKSTDKLTTDASHGSTLNVDHFKNHLESRYLSEF